MGKLNNNSFDERELIRVEEQYRQIASESYDMIGKEINLQIEIYPEVRELRFVKVAGMQLMYDAYALEGTDIPAIEGADFLGLARRRELGDLLSSELKDGALPKEVRVIRPKHGRDFWEIFFKR